MKRHQHLGKLSPPRGTVAFYGFPLGLLLATTVLGDGFTPTEPQRRELRKAFCAADPCNDKVYGGCEDAQCLRWSLDVELDRISGKDRSRYEQECLLCDCPIALPSETPMGELTLGEIVDGWTQQTQQSRNASCGSVAPDPFDLLLPAEIQALSASFEQALAVVRCAHPESARVRSSTGRALAAWRNSQRCIQPLRSLAGCDGSDGRPCNASAEEVAAWTTPQRNLCLGQATAAGHVEVYVCRSKPDHLQKRDALTDRPVFGTVCPRDRELASSVDQGTCRKLMRTSLPSAGAEAAFGCAQDAVGCVFVIDVMPSNSSQEDLLPLVPGFHDHRGGDHPIVTTSLQLGWQSVSPALDAVGEAVTVLYGSLSGEDVYLELYRPGEPVPMDARKLEGWRLDDLFAEPRQSCHPQALHRARGELAQLARALLAEDPNARPLTDEGWLQVPVTDREQPVFRRCFRFRGQPVCFEHRVAESVPPPPSEPRTLAWQLDFDSPLLHGVPDARRWAWLEAYLALRPRSVPEGARIGVVALDVDASGPVARPPRGTALIGISGEPPVVLRRHPEISTGERAVPAGPVLGRYLAILVDSTVYQPGRSDEALRRVFQVASSAGEGILATDPVAGAGSRIGQACVLRLDGPYCGTPGTPFEPLLGSGTDVAHFAVAGLGRFSAAFNEAVTAAAFNEAVTAADAQEPGAASAAWRASETALEALVAAGAGPRSLFALTPRSDSSGDDAVLVEPAPENDPGPCRARARWVPMPTVPASATIGELSRPFILVPLTSPRPGATCTDRIRDSVRDLVNQTRLPRLIQVADALEDGLGGDTEVYVGPPDPDPNRSGLRDIAIVRTGARPDGSGARLSLVDDRLAVKVHQPFPPLAHQLLHGPPSFGQAPSNESVGTLEERVAVIDCFLARTCHDMQTTESAAEPISYFSNQGDGRP